MSQIITVPPLGESVTEATVSRWLKRVGESVKVDEPLVELETDKVTLEVNASAAGVLSQIDASEGTTVTVGQTLGSLGEGSGVSAAPAPAPVMETVSTASMAQAAAAAAPAAVLTPMPLTTPAPVQTPPVVAFTPLAPAVRKLVEENNVNPADVAASGKDGRLTKGDVLTHMHTGNPQQSVPAQGPSPVETKTVAPYVGRVGLTMNQPEERVKMSRLRQRIAERLKEAQNTAAMLTTFNEIDMAPIMDARERYRDKFEKKFGTRLGFMSFFVKAAVAALKEIPAVNAEIDGDYMVYKNHYDIGVAVAAPQGLVVPVVRDADHLNFADIELKIQELGEKAKQGKLSMDELSGGTFTITNGGVFGSLMSTPILNPPQSGILGMHKIEKRAVVINDKIEIRPMMYVALTYDHRVIDGREAVTFLARIKEYVEDPWRLLLEI